MSATPEVGAVLTAEDHAVISRCADRQPALYMRGSHEGYYVHSDVADLIDIIGRLLSRPSLEPPASDVAGWRESVQVALAQAKRGADKAGCDGWRAQEMCRQIVPLLEKALTAAPPHPASKEVGDE